MFYSSHGLDIQFVNPLHPDQRRPIQNPLRISPHVMEMNAPQLMDVASH